MHSGTKRIAALMSLVITRRCSALPYIMDSQIGFNRKLINTVLIRRAMTTRCIDTGFR